MERVEHSGYQSVDVSSQIIRVCDFNDLETVSGSAVSIKSNSKPYPPQSFIKQVKGSTITIIANQNIVAAVHQTREGGFESGIHANQGCFVHKR